MNRVYSEIRRLRSSTLARNAGWVLAGQGTALVLQAGYFVFLARLLGTREYGIYAGAFAFASFGAVFSSLGSGTLFLRYVGADHRRFSIYWGNILATTSILSAILVVGLWLASTYLMDRTTANVVFVVALANCFCSQLTTCAGQVFQSFENLRATASFNLLTNFLRFVAVIVLIESRQHATAMEWAVASLLASFAALIIALISVTSRFGKPKFSHRAFFSHAAEGFGYSFASSTSSAYNDLDKTMLSHYGMNVANGIYSMAYRIVDIATIPIIAIRDAAMPRFFKKGMGSPTEVETFSTTLLKRAIPIAALGALVIFCVAPIIPMIVGRTFEQSVSAVRWLCWLPIFRAAHQITGSAIAGAGGQRYRTAAQLSCAGINWGLNLWLIPLHGWRGAAWSSLVTDGTLFVINWMALKWFIKRQQLKHEEETLIVAPSMAS